MKKEYILLLLMICLFNMNKQIVAQKLYNFEQVTVKDGLLSNKVSVIHRDNLGYMWIGTNHGLHKFDGEHMHRHMIGYQSDKELNFDFVYFVFEDKNSTLWVSTNAGLLKYNRIKNKLVQSNNPLLQKKYFTYCTVPDGFVLGNEDGLIEYNCVHDKVEKVKLKQGYDWRDFRLESDGLGNIYLSTRSGLWYYNRITKKMNQVGRYSVNGTIALMVDKSDVAWICNTAEGLMRFTSAGSVAERLKIQDYIDPKIHFIQDITAKGDQIWFSTDGEGIIIYDTSKLTIQGLKHQQGVKSSLTSNSLLDLHVDNYGNVLAGSVRAGLISINEVHIQSFTENLPSYQYGLSHPTVVAFYEDRYGKIWIGTDGGGLNVFDPDNGTFEHIKEFGRQKVVSICEYRPNLLLISFYRGQTQLFDLEEKRFINEEQESWLLEVSEPNSNYPVIFKRDIVGNIWKFGTELKRILKDGSVQKIDVDSGWSGDLETFFSSMVVKSEDEFFFGGKNGVYLVNTKEKRFIQILSLRDDIKGHYRDFRYVYSMVQQDQMLWIASSVGFLSINIETNEVKHYENELFRNAFGIEKAVDNSLWISTGTGLYQFFPESNTFLNHGRSKGVRHYEFVNRSILKTEQGDVYIGAVDGMVKIKANEFRETINDSLSITIDHIMMDGVVGVDKETFDGSAVVLPWNNSSLRINLIVNEKNFFRKRLFRYSIEGYSDEIIETTNSQLSLSHLPSGLYTLKVFCNKADGTWSLHPARLNINVLIPWWRTWWFFLFIFVLIGFLFVMIKHFLTKQSKLVIELELEREIKDQVRQLNEKKLDFFTNISHELRTPLSLIYGPLKRIVDDELFVSDEKWSQLHLMYRQADKMKRLIDQVLDIRKIDTGNEALNLTAINLKDWLNKFFIQFELELQNKCLNLKNLSSDVGIVEFDVDKLDKVLSNLVINAIKYSPIGGTIYFSTKVEADKISFAIEDEGKGISEEDIDKLFEKFYQAKEHQAGSGVGLAYSKSLVNLMGGQIRAQNRLDGGALFKFYLPLKQNVKGALLNTQNLPLLPIDKTVSTSNLKNDYSILRNKLILIVEDDPELRKFISDGLGDYCDTIEASDGKEALSMIFSNSPDLIVSDVMMPQMNGFELCTNIKNDIEISHLPVLLLTARSDGESRLQGYKAGADAYLSKPFSLDVLCVRMINIFNNREAHKELIKDSSAYSIMDATYSNADEVFMRKLIQVINVRMSDPDFDVNQLNAEVAMSRSTFYSKIKAITGLGVNDFIKQLKNNKAIELLTKTDMPIGTIALEVGYINQRYFSTVFKEINGCTPSQYRQMKK